MLPKEYFDDPLIEGVAFDKRVGQQVHVAQAPRRLRQDSYCDAGC